MPPGRALQDTSPPAQKQPEEAAAMDVEVAQVAALKEQSQAARAAAVAEGGAVAEDAPGVPPPAKAPESKPKKGPQAKTAPAADGASAVAPAGPPEGALAGVAGSSTDNPNAAAEPMPLADLLRRQLLEAPNVADEIEALRKERQDKRKEVAAASRKLRQDMKQAP
jgi:hypothetical protein